jgi:tRNA-specific 2-thiouridylase
MEIAYGWSPEEIHFQHPQTAVTPGQAAVIYLGDQVLGGGWIEETWKD